MLKKYRLIAALIFILVTAVIFILVTSETKPEADSITEAPKKNTSILVWGTVRDTKNSPVTNTVITVGGRGSRTGQDGSYKLSASPGMHFVSFRNPTTGQRYQKAATFEQQIFIGDNGKNQYDFVIEEIESSTPSPSPTATPIILPAPQLQHVTRNSTGRIDVDFSGPTSTDTAVGLTGYRVERSAQESTGYARIAEVPVNNVGRYLYIDSDLRNTTSGTYYYRVISLKNNITSDPSNVKSITLGSSATPTPSPSTPAAPSRLTVTTTTENVITASWQDNASNESGYYVYRSTNTTTPPTDYTLIRADARPGAPNNASITETMSIADRATYAYWVQAFRTTSNGELVSSLIGPITVKLNGPGPLLAPNSLKAKSLVGRRIQLTWRGDTAVNTGYEIWRSTDNQTFQRISDIPDNVNYIDKSGLQNKRTYYYKIRAYKTIRSERIYSEFSNVSEAKG